MNSAKVDIRNFLIVLCAGMLCAIALTWVMVKTDPYDRHRKLHDILISPETIETISNRAGASSKGKSASFMIERITLSNATPQDQWKDTQIDISGYSKLFNTLKEDKGIWESEMSDQLLEGFTLPHLPSLAIYIKEQQPYQSSGKVELFQQMQFSPASNWYRVELYVKDRSQIQWVYFHHTHLDQLLKEIKTP